MKRLLYRLTGNLPLHIISDNDRPYLERYFLFKRFGVEADTLADYANAVGLFEPKWVVKAPGVRVLTGTSFEMRTDGDANQINVYLAGEMLSGQVCRQHLDAEKFVEDYIKTHRERLVAFGFIEQE